MELSNFVFHVSNLMFVCDACNCFVLCFILWHCTVLLCFILLFCTGFGMENTLHYVWVMLVHLGILAIT